MESEPYKSKTVRSLLIGIGAIILALVILRVGVFIGYQKAIFAGPLGNSFERNFLGPRGGGMGMMFIESDIPGGHGAVGEIVSIDSPRFIISGPDNLEKTILTSTSTLVRRFRDNIEISDLETGEFVVVIGNPNSEGEVEAKLIRVMPESGEEFNMMISR